MRRSGKSRQGGKIGKMTNINNLDKRTFFGEESFIAEPTSQGDAEIEKKRRGFKKQAWGDK